jgi:hypothetical protein
MWSRNLDQCRQDASQHSILSAWFDLYKKAFSDYEVLKEDEYNMDEKGFMKGIGDDSKVIVPVEEMEAFSVQPGNREWVSVIECIGTDGFYIPGFVIFKGKLIQENWIPDIVDRETVINVSENGWTDSGIALDWIKHFDKHTKMRTKGKYRLLILDGHTSHVSLPFVQYCEANNIVPLCFPPHSTHILQPLDVGIFSPFAKAYKTLIQRHSMFGTQRVTNEQFLIFYHLARKDAFSPENIESAWSSTGLIPFDPSHVLEKYRPTTPLTAVSTEFCAQLQPAQAEKVNEILAALSEITASPFKGQLASLKNIALTAIAENQSLQKLNDEMLKKQKVDRGAQTRKNYGNARVLTVKECLEKKEERKRKEEEVMTEKQRKAALRGVITFAKNVWKEFKMGTDIFE